MEQILDAMKTALDLGLTFALLAEYERDGGNLERYERGKRNAIKAAEAIERCKERLPPSDAKKELERRAFDLALLITAL
jgi:hypothetical protein